MKKQCSMCEKALPLFLFRKGDGEHGRKPFCKTCGYTLTQGFKRTRSGVIASIYETISNKSKPQYSLEQLDKVLYSNKIFNDLYRFWVILNYDEDSKPTIDLSKGIGLHSMVIVPTGEYRNDTVRR